MLPFSKVVPAAAVLVAVQLCLPLIAQAASPDEEAQSFVRQAVLALEQDNVDTAVKLLDKAADAAALIPDAPWRDAIFDETRTAIIAVLAAAGAAKWESGNFDASYKFYERALGRGGGGLRSDEIRTYAARSIHLHMLQVWLSGDEKAARSLATMAHSVAQSAFSASSSERRDLDALSSKIARPRSLEVLVKSEIERTKRSIEADAPRFPDPRPTYRLGLLAHTVRAFDLAEKLFTKALEATDKSERNEDRAITIGSSEKIEHIRSLTRRVTIRSNVPFYTVELWRPDAPLPEGAADTEDASAGVSFTVYPGRYQVKVFNAEYGTCERDDVIVETVDTVARCRFDAPPVVVTLEAEPKNLEARVAPSDMIEWRALPFTLNLMRGRYTLSVKHPAFRDPVDVPFVVSKDGKQNVSMDLTHGTLEMDMPKEHHTAVVKVDGRDVPRIGGNQVQLTAGAHVVEVFQSGYKSFRQQIVIRPHGQTLVAPRMERGLSDDETPPPERSTLSSRVTYEAALRDFELTGYDRNGDLNTVRRTYPLHQTAADVRVYVGEVPEPYSPRWFVHAGADVAFAQTNPIDDMLLATVRAGFGVELPSRGGEWLQLGAAYQIAFDKWTSTWADGAFNMTETLPIGLAVQALTRLGWLSISIDAGFLMGSGVKRQDSATPNLPTGDVDLDVMVLEARALVGFDLVDLFQPDPDLDVILGPVGYLTWYREQRSDKGAPFQAASGGAGLVLSGRYAIHGPVTTTITGDVEARPFGDLAPELPAIFDEKTRVDAVAGVGNVSFRLGVEVGF